MVGKHILTAARAMGEAVSDLNTSRLLTRTTDPSQEQHVNKSPQNNYSGENDKLPIKGGDKQLSGKLMLN